MDGQISEMRLVLNEHGEEVPGKRSSRRAIRA
jgi:hypothetical protein